MSKILLINGPNLSFLGEREPDIYGHESLDAIVERLRATARAAGYELEHFQSNAEHELIDRVLDRRAKVDAIIINPGAYGHTSRALGDALSARNIPYFEVHISNVFAREAWRRQLVLAANASGVLCGLGTLGYDLALQAVLARFNAQPTFEGK